MHPDLAAGVAGPLPSLYGCHVGGGCIGFHGCHFPLYYSIIHGLSCLLTQADGCWWMQSGTDSVVFRMVSMPASPNEEEDGDDHTHQDSKEGEEHHRHCNGDGVVSGCCFIACLVCR